jgi:selenocysteine lyase/cysteine desulfurase
MITPTQFREHFPVLRDKVHFASCSQGALSVELSGALRRFEQQMVEHPNPWAGWMAEVERARAMFAGLIGADPADIAIVSCASEGAFQVASGYDWRPGDSIVTSAVEFPSVAHVWLAQRTRGVAVRHAVPSRDPWLLGVDDFAAVMDTGARLVSVPLVAYQHGHRLPVRAVTELAHDRGARVFVDAYQGFGVEPVDVRELDCDYLVSGAVKYGLGVPGIAFLYIRPGLPCDLAPQLTGWFARADPFAFDPFHLDYAADARRFQTGTPPVPAAYGAVAGFGLLADLDTPALAAHVADLAELLHERLMAAGFTIASPADRERRGPQVAVEVPDPDRVSAQLDQRGVSTSPRGRLLRLSMHYYNLDTDIERVVDELRRLRGAG